MGGKKTYSQEQNQNIILQTDINHQNIQMSVLKVAYSSGFWFLEMNAGNRR